MSDDLDDTHLCIKCKLTIAGLDNYIQHRKQNCSKTTISPVVEATNISTSTSTSTQGTSTDVTPAITYEPLSFIEPEPPNPASHGGKTSKALTESYELPYGLEADIFFSSLQLQSVQSTVSHQVPSTSGGKTGNLPYTGPLTRQKSMQLEAETHTTSGVSWLGTRTPQRNSGEQLLKDAIFKTMTYEPESPEVTEEEDEEDEGEGEGDNEIIDDDQDEDYDPVADAHGTGGKWKLTLMRHSPPVVPISHTGGKWKPENRPNLRVTHSQISRASPNWDDNLDDGDTTEDQHPPADHTKGKWLPGTKLQRLEYKEEVQLAKCSNTNQDYWCNICCRKLKSKSIYEHHLKTSFHTKRAEPELQLEKAAIKKLPKDVTKKALAYAEFKPLSITVATNNTNRKRRCTYLKCSLCKHVLNRNLIGKHLISHYHYRRMQQQPEQAWPMILENIQAIVLQSPFQCRPCRFYANTEETFLLHWNSAFHSEATEDPGHFWCSYCQFECDSNSQMLGHLLSSQHKEVILVINRSVPICISKILSLDCSKCGKSFRFNFELRRHFVDCHSGVEFMGTASDAYQSKFKCPSCPDILLSKIALQRHEKFKHFIDTYFCSICKLEFHSPCQARRHRKTLEHKQKSLAANEKTTKTNQKVEVHEPLDLKMIKSPLKIENPELDYEPSTSMKARENLLEQKYLLADVTLKCKDCPFTASTSDELTLHGQSRHINTQHNCILCSKTFSNGQELGRHTRVCQPMTKLKPEEVELPTQLQEVTTEQGETVWLCDLCNFRAPLRSETLYHRVFHSYFNVGKNTLVPCPLCKKSFRKQSLRFHLNNHTKEKRFQCEICTATYARPNHLKDHMKKMHGEVQNTGVDVSAATKEDASFACPSCDKAFKNKHSMKMHRLTHHVTESTPEQKHKFFKCNHENCDYSTLRKSLLTIHLSSHARESFKCKEVDCKYVGKSKLHMKRHLQSHLAANETKNFSCEQCSFKTNIKSHLRRHIRKHTGEKPYSCPYCDFHSTTWENLRKHILKTGKHAGKFVFECEKCKEEKLDVDKDKHENIEKKVFKTNSHQEYQKHLKSEHKDENKGILHY